MGVTNAMYAHPVNDEKMDGLVFDYRLIQSHERLVNSERGRQLARRYH
jgi:hypothetical protein